MKIKHFNYELIILPTIGDGSCFLHAILQSCSKDYINSNIENKRKIVRQLRNDMSDILDYKEENKEENFYQRLSRGELGEISKFVIETNKDFMKAYLKSDYWFNMYYIELVSLLLNINIVIVSNKEKEIYKLGDKELYFQERNTVLINYLDQAHFETIGIRTKEGIKTFFNHKSKIFKDLKNIV